MILLIENSRLGNKLFQYVGLKKYFPKEKIMFLGRENIKLLFDNVDFNFVNLEKINFSLFHVLKHIIIFLIKVRLFGVMYENTSKKDFEIEIKKGLCWWIFVSHNNFFQHSDIIEHIYNPPILKPEILKKGINWLKEKKIDYINNKIVFVHIRRGDYLKWPSKSFPAALSIDWYKKSINFIKKKINNPIFIFMSDDQQYLYDFFKETDTLFISDNHPEIDLSIMSLCSSGVLSSSSFAWWGAFFARTNNVENNYFLAPKYWIGHKTKKWFPENFSSKWIYYI
ncbi:alpha-1,2-fucosyltransferase [Candidatus Pelagibacter ubique]|nr:alpha-1,2-fucosyltransferase [Candidatus Pelagibacter ubique]